MPALPFANEPALLDHLYQPVVMPQTSLINISIPPEVSCDHARPFCKGQAANDNLLHGHGTKACTCAVAVWQAFS